MSHLCGSSDTSSNTSDTSSNTMYIVWADPPDHHGNKRGSQLHNNKYGMDQLYIVWADSPDHQGNQRESQLHNNKYKVGVHPWSRLQQ